MGLIAPHGLRDIGPNRWHRTGLHQHQLQPVASINAPAGICTPRGQKKPLTHKCPCSIHWYIQPPAVRRIMSEHARANLLRLMATADLSIDEVARRTGLDERTVQRGPCGVPAAPTPGPSGRPGRRARRAARRVFRRSGPLALSAFRAPRPPGGRTRCCHSQSELFAAWRETDFDELHSRLAAAGTATRDDALRAVADMNRRRVLHARLDILGGEQLRADRQRHARLDVRGASAPGRRARRFAKRRPRSNTPAYCLSLC